MADLFNGKVAFEYLLNLPSPLLNDLRDAQIKYLQEKAKAETEALQEAERRRNASNKK